MLQAVQAHDADVGVSHVYNLGTDETVILDDSIAVILAHLGVSPKLEHTGGSRGWPGDSPLIHLDCSRIRALGWKPTLTIQQSIVRTLDWLAANPYALRQPAPVR
jgi:UDP-glucose 4-epimerase